MKLEQRVAELEQRLAEVERKLGLGHGKETMALASTWPGDQPPKRLSIPMPRFGMKRPVVLQLQQMFGLKETGEFDLALETAVKEFQRSRGLDDDGIVGPKTWAELLPDHHSDLWLRIYEWVATVETGSRSNSFGMGEPDIGDGAGANYGVIQYNNCGSMERLLKSAGKYDLLQLYEKHDRTQPLTEIKQWIGSEEGVQAQMEDVTKTIIGPAISLYQKLSPTFCGTIDAEAERLVCLLADIRVQNGSLYSPYRGPSRQLYIDYFVKEMSAYMDDPETLAEETLQRFNNTNGTYSERNRYAIDALVQALEDDQNALAVALAIYRGACSKERWAERVIWRKLVVAKGHGEVHGYRISMYDDFGIGTPVGG